MKIVTDFDLHFNIRRKRGFYKFNFRYMTKIERQNYALIVIRTLSASTMIIHGTARIFADGVFPFGEFLSAVGFPAGAYLAWTITLIEIVGGITLLTGYLITLISVFFAFQLFSGIILVHGKEGWFVVGLGRNGMEYSVLLIISFLCIAYANFGENNKNE